ncbi:hypothetical protein D3C86_1598410 [compost metagenome]
MGCQKINDTLLPGTVTAASGSLQEPRHAFGPANLYDGFYRRKIYSEVKARGTDDSLELFIAYRLFYPLPCFAADASVVHGHIACKFRILF